MPDRDITRRGRLISRYTAALRRRRAAAPTWLGRLVQCTVTEVEPEMRPCKRMSPGQQQQAEQDHPSSRNVKHHLRTNRQTGLSARQEKVVLTCGDAIVSKLNESKSGNHLGTTNAERAVPQLSRRTAGRGSFSRRSGSCAAWPAGPCRPGSRLRPRGKWS